FDHLEAKSIFLGLSAGIGDKGEQLFVLWGYCGCAPERGERILILPISDIGLRQEVFHVGIVVASLPQVLQEWNGGVVLRHAQVTQREVKAHRIIIAYLPLCHEQMRDGLAEAALPR